MNFVLAVLLWSLFFESNLFAMQWIEGRTAFGLIIGEQKQKFNEDKESDTESSESVDEKTDSGQEVVLYKLYQPPPLTKKKELSFSERQRLQRLVDTYSTPIHEVGSELIGDEESEVEYERYSAPPDEEVLRRLPAALDEQAKKLFAEIKAKEDHSLREQETPQDLEAALPCYQEGLTKFFQIHE